MSGILTWLMRVHRNVIFHWITFRGGRVKHLIMFCSNFRVLLLSKFNVTVNHCGSPPSNRDNIEIDPKVGLCLPQSMIECLWCKIKLWHVTIYIKVIMIMFSRELNWWFYPDLFMWKCISIWVAYPWYCQIWDNMKESMIDYCLVTMLKDYYLMLNYVLIIMAKGLYVKFDV
jgi:hypothetical protein